MIDLWKLTCNFLLQDHGEQTFFRIDIPFRVQLDDKNELNPTQSIPKI